MNSVLRNKLFIFFSILGLIVAVTLTYWLFSNEEVEPLNAFPRDVAGIVVLKDAVSLLPESEREKYEYLRDTEVWFSVFGLRSSEQPLTDSDSNLNLTPKFVALLRTNAWDWQMSSIVDGPVTTFVKGQLGEEVKKTVSRFGERRVDRWASESGQEAFVFVIGDAVIVSNDKTALEETFAAIDGKKDSISADNDFLDFLSANEATPLAGYFPKKALDEFSAAAGVTAAVNASEGTLPRLAISQTLPGILNTNVKTIYWTSKREKDEIVDEFEFVLERRAREVFTETLKKSAQGSPPNSMKLPKNAASYSFYNFSRPRIAFRSLLLVAGEEVKGPAKAILPAVFSSLFQPYGVGDAEAFLAVTGKHFVTVAFEDEDEALVAFEADDISKVLETVACCSEKSDDARLVGQSEDFELAYVDGVAYLGTRGTLAKALGGESATQLFGEKSDASIVTKRKTKFEGETVIELVETSSTGRSIVRTSRTRQGLIGSFLPSK